MASGTLKQPTYKHSALAALQNLQKRGFTTSQAQGIVEEMVTQESLHSELALFEAKIDTKLADLKSELKAEIIERTAQLEVRLIQTMSAMKIDMIKWMISLQLGSLGFTSGLIYFLLRR